MGKACFKVLMMVMFIPPITSSPKLMPQTLVPMTRTLMTQTLMARMARLAPSMEVSLLTAVDKDGC
jgi:hypothetical protein